MSKLTYQELNITEPEEGIIEFEVLPEHLKLLRGAYVAWQETENGWGAFQINEKTPYGSLQIARNISTLVEDPDIEVDRCLELHKGAAMALQIFLKTGKFKAAKYRATKYGQDWREYKPRAVKEKKVEETLFIHQTPIDPAKSYGELLSMLADQLDVIKQRASDLYKEAHDAGVSPEDMDADYALVELDLAEYTEDYELFTGLPEVRYSNPTVDEDECDGECCDKTEEDDDD